MFLECIDNWRKSLAKKSKEQDHNNDENLVNPDDLQLYLKSQRSKEAKQMLAHGIYENSLQAHTQVRNNLLFRISVANFHRPGCITNMKIEEFQSSESRSGDRVIRVADHKTRYVFSLVQSTAFFKCFIFL